MPSITINGAPVEAAKGSTILEAARAAGIGIPSLCYLKDVSHVASCRVCVVEVDGIDHPVPACATPVADGMSVTTSSPRLDTYRRIALELLLADHGISSLDECAACPSDGACELQGLCRAFGVGKAKDAAADGASGGSSLSAVPSPARRRQPVIDSNPFLRYDANRCIACYRCVGACNTRACNHILQAGKRGVRTTILAPFGPDWKETTCESCGACAQACPTGALSEKRRDTYAAAKTHTVRTTCPHCGVGCQIDLVVEGDRVVDARGADGPSNGGRLCVKGRSASFDFLSSADRLTTPLVRNASSGKLEPASWDDALDLVARRFGEIKAESGPDSLAAFACSRSTNEDVYMLQKLARTAFGTNNVDSCARV